MVWGEGSLGVGKEAQKLRAHWTAVFQGVQCVLQSWHEHLFPSWPSRAALTRVLALEQRHWCRPALHTEQLVFREGPWQLSAPQNNFTVNSCSAVEGRSGSLAQFSVSRGTGGRVAALPGGAVVAMGPHAPGPFRLGTCSEHAQALG